MNTPTRCDGDGGDRLDRIAATVALKTGYSLDFAQQVAGACHLAKGYSASL